MAVVGHGVEVDGNHFARLGQGSFGSVFRGQWRGAEVAIKCQAQGGLWGSFLVFTGLEPYARV